MSEYLSLQDAAAIVGVHVDTLRKAIASRKLKALRAGRQIRIRRTDLDAWLEPVN
ncbi:DNA-binding protein [Rhodococcus sp. 06-470-2]|jgi:excisionase family DNA binding protein|uniref:helix-turn-helix domain-containing protein n=1 Tax=Nocardiaceae TaxID=85025 RepID=UPI0009B8C384|nr:MULTISPECIES: helix-turn-helix domain-containing protein [Rhodococcus]OZC70225.1 DNA-binding protein [Rhodococcus sp. 06-470-2]OZE59742.1 DNA-binding protein [Rhodococcus sp. 05-2221-1B]WQH30216.1 helix-turn-helix domain-containing protein [Rhodococcus fascians]